MKALGRPVHGVAAMLLFEVLSGRAKRVATMGLQGAQARKPPKVIGLRWATRQDLPPRYRIRDRRPARVRVGDKPSERSDRP